MFHNSKTLDSPKAIVFVYIVLDYKTYIPH